MSTGITRRDFMNGIAIAVVGAAGVDLSRAQAPDGSTEFALVEDRLRAKPHANRRGFISFS